VSEPHTPGREAEPPDPRRWRALAVTLAAGFMTLLDVSIVNVALPSMQHGLGASPQGIQWVVSGYALTFGLTLVAGGRLGDLLGRRRMFLIALTGFVVTSAAAGAAPNEALLVTARLVQGLAAGMLTPQNSGLIQDLFRGAERGRAFGMLGATIGISTAAGPVIGGLILAAFGDQEGWRWVFYVNVPIGVVALVLAARLVPPGRPDRGSGGGSARSRIDFVGMALLGVTTLGVLLPLVQSTGGGDPWLWLLIPVAAGIAVVFVRWERATVRRGHSPLLDLRLFTDTSGFASGAVLATIYFCGFSGIWLVLSLFFQDGLGYTPLQSGLSVTPFALGSAATAMIAGRLVSRWGRRLTVTGLSLIVVGLGTAAVLLRLTHDPSHTGFVLIAPLFVAGVGGGAVISPNTTLTLACVPTSLAGSAGGALQTGQRIGTAIGTAVLATVFRSTVTRTRGDYPIAASTAVFCAIVFVVAALVVAVLELRAGRRTGPTDDEPERRDFDDAVRASDVHRS
jgi:EmrB/QacA subfamily drug resistance transporter